MFEHSDRAITRTDKHGQLGIWDARAAPDEVADEDEDIASPNDREGGQYWRLQVHWPATSKSSISTVKFDPVNSHNVRRRIAIYGGMFLTYLSTGIHKLI